MYLTQSKYGFLTTYEQTIFLKQDKHPTRKGRWVLWHSPVILHDTQSRRVPGPSGRGQDLSNPALYRQRVSLRECFLFLIDLACGEKTAMNTMKLNTWVVGQDFKFDQHDYVSDESPSSSSEEDSSKPYSAQRGDISTSRASTHKQAQESASMADLESLTSRVILGDKPQLHSELPWHRGGDVMVYFSDSQQRWYYKDSRGTRVYVDLHEEERSDGPSRAYFIQGGYRYRVRRDRGKQRAR